MNATTAVAIRQPTQLTTDAWRMIETVAPAMHLCRFFGVASKEQAAAIMLYGHDLGLGLSASFQFVQVVEGKPTLSPRGALAIVMNSGLLAGLKITESKDACTVWMKRRGNPELEYEFTWSMADAEQAGIVKDRGAWKSYPRLMLKWRAVGYVIDWLFSDVTGGLKRADEFDADLTPAGDVVEGSWAEVAPVAGTNGAHVPVAVSRVTLDDLIQSYGADAVMDAAEGRIPGSAEEVAVVATKLAAGSTP